MAHNPPLPSARSTMMGGRPPRLHRWLRLTAGAASCLVASVAFAQPGAADQESTLPQIRQQLNQAQQQSLAERVSTLKTLDRQMGQLLESGTLGPKKEAVLLKLRYRTRRGLARHEKAHKSFAEFAAAMRRWNRSRAQRAVPEFVQNQHAPGKRSETVALADAALGTWSDDDQAASALLYTKAKALSHIPGRREAALPVLEQIISEHPESEYHPKALRWLAHLQTNYYGEGPDAALKTLDLLERQYAGTWWEQYAHMKDAMLFENVQGKPQKALERYRATLDRFPTHKYAPFVRKQINRLQGVIEQQLIDDALKNVRGEGQNHQDEARSLAHRSGEMIGFKVEHADERVSLRK